MGQRETKKASVAPNDSGKEADAVPGSPAARCPMPPRTPLTRKRRKRRSGTSATSVASPRGLRRSLDAHQAKRRPSGSLNDGSSRSLGASSHRGSPNCIGRSSSHGRGLGKNRTARAQEEEKEEIEPVEEEEEIVIHPDPDVYMDEEEIAVPPSMTSLGGSAVFVQEPAFENEEDIEVEPFGSRDPPQSPLNPSSAPDDFMIEATLVKDEEEEDLLLVVPAQAVNIEETKKKEKKARKQQLLKIGLMLLVFLVLAVGLTVGLAARPFQPSKEDIDLVLESSQPTGAPTPIHLLPPGPLDLMFDMLPIYIIDRIEDPNSDQAKAWKWLEQHPELEIMVEWRKWQLFGVATFFFALGGEDWPRDSYSSTWLDGRVPECLWSLGSLPNAHQGWVLCDGNKGHIQDIYLSNLDLGYLKPSIPLQLGFLTKLTSLGLVSNNFTHSLHDLIPDCPSFPLRLRELNLKANPLLTGTIPASFGCMENLEQLHLESSGLSGPLPSQLGNLQELISLQLAYNQLSGTIPTQIGLLSNLVELSLSYNQVTGSLPSELGTLSYLDTLSFANNSMTGPIPSQLGMATSMSVLHGSNNSLHGPLPSQLGQARSLWSIFLSDNRLTGWLPTELGQLEVISNLNLGNNQLSGTIPSELGLLRASRVFFSVYPSMDTSVNSGHMFGVLDLSKNNMTGCIPSELGAMQNLPLILLAENNLSCSIPSELGLLLGLPLELFVLDFADNPLLGGPMPQELMTYEGYQLQVFDIQGTAVSGDLPESFCEMGCSQGDWCQWTFDCSHHLCGCDCVCVPPNTLPLDEEWPASSTPERGRTSSNNSSETLDDWDAFSNSSENLFG